MPTRLREPTVDYPGTACDVLESHQYSFSLHRFLRGTNDCRIDDEMEDLGFIITDTPTSSDASKNVPMAGRLTPARLRLM